MMSSHLTYKQRHEPQQIVKELLNTISAGDRLLSSLKVLLQDSVFAGGRPLGDKMASAQILVDRIMQRPPGLGGNVVRTVLVERTLSVN